MKLKLPDPVQIPGPNGKTIAISAGQVVEHVVRNARDLGLSNDVERVRIGARIIAAATTGDIDAPDLAELKKALINPPRGWVTIAVDVAVPLPPDAPTGTQPRTMRHQLVPSAIDLLPLIDALLNA